MADEANNSSSQSKDIDINLDELRLTVNRGVTAAAGEIEVKPPKSGEPRTVSIDVDTAGMLKLHREAQDIIAERYDWSSTDAYLFAVGDDPGVPMHPDSVLLQQKQCTAKKD